jgi:uncharacterized membrane protein
MKKKRKYSKIFTFTLFIFFFLWILMQFISPFIIKSNSINELSGLTGIYDNSKIYNNFSFPANIVYSIGDIFCHQISDRSLYLNGNQMPFCSRCTAIWFGLALGLALMIFYSVKLNDKFLLIIILGILPLGIDGFGQLIGLWDSTNLIRVITGLITGVICGVAIGVIIDEIITYKNNKKNFL